jgi:predicted nucleotidyltransferase
MKIGRIDIPEEQLRSYCKRWKIVELSVFGSALRDDFREKSDVDVLISLEPGIVWGLKWFQMKRELEAMVGREVDLVAKNALRNPFRRHEILSTRQVVYAA